MVDEGIDSEIAAMSAVAGALNPLEPEQQVRVLRWAADRYGLADLKFANTGARGAAEELDDSRGSGAGGDKPSYSSIDELFESGIAKTNTQKALLAAYWFQVVEGKTGWQSYTLNTALKNLGIGITNITDALATAENQKPVLVMQTSKTGKSRQARKTYKLTAAGVKAVEAMLNGNAD
ncbi:hypothetical protein [Homoserinibacter sp. GY 40078]|uniref:hypothetical protein n=1 Tax=Homoserinibacter sp. GY 40078 TaxID=2603275 RepID=UPI0011CACDC0|nr:hypothetical protein [Homoserinibacter sp. GY 40078]TXK18447.1 hypothetical protein FVQ89_00320 [Homoserinibacter sp. GY 40078]